MNDNHVTTYMRTLAEVDGLEDLYPEWFEPGWDTLRNLDHNLGHAARHRADFRAEAVVHSCHNVAPHRLWPSYRVAHMAQWSWGHSTGLPLHILVADSGDLDDNLGAVFPVVGDSLGNDHNYRAGHMYLSWLDLAYNRLVPGLAREMDGSGPDHTHLYYPVVENIDLEDLVRRGYPLALGPWAVLVCHLPVVA